MPKAGKKETKTSTITAGEVTVGRELKRRGKVLGKEAGSQSVKIDNPIQGPIAEVTCNIGRTTQTIEYESLRVDVGGRLPCSIEDFKSGVAHKEIIQICREELRDQLARGTKGL